MIKRIMTSLLVMALMAVIFSTTAFAAGHHGSTTTNRVSYSVCTVEGCNLTYNHSHNGKYYYGHTLSDGHTYHQLCTVEDCTLTATHTHDGSTYFGHHLEDGHEYHVDWHYTGDGHNHSSGQGTSGHH